MCLFKHIVLRLMEEDNVISYEEALKMVLLRSLEWFAVALTTISSVFLLKQLASSLDLLFDSCKKLQLYTWLSVTFWRT